MSCCVPGCVKYTGMSSKFARIPKDTYFCDIWLKKIKNLFLLGLDLKKLYNHRICIRHFEAEYINYNASKNQSCLKKDAIPTLLLGEGELNAELDFQKLYENYKTVPSIIQGETGMETDEPVFGPSTSNISPVPGPGTRDMSPVLELNTQGILRILGLGTVQIMATPKKRGN
ncbi:hypothetical protein CBL_08536 [Carabus blaptoides fortunei]